MQNLTLFTNIHRDRNLTTNPKKETEVQRDRDRERSQIKMDYH